MLAILLAAAGLTLILTSCGSVKVGNKMPQTDLDYGKSSVSITLENKRSGGSGVILRSTAAESIVLTNRHVCNLIQNGGVVNADQGTYPITAYKVYTKHDLCMVKIQANLHFNTKLAEAPPNEFDSILVSGHPHLLPTLITKGHFSKHMVIQLIVGMDKCDGTETGDDVMYCIFTGGKPILMTFDSQVTSALIMPGSSGSGVFNNKGELSGLVFAGPGEGLGFGFIVPYEYVANFLRTARTYPWTTPNPDAPAHNLFKQMSVSEKACNAFVKDCRVKSHGLFAD